jgi:MFS transporter, ACS family, glucarate transporter
MDSSHPTKARYNVVALTLLLTAIAYLDRVSISTAAPVIKESLGLDDGQMGMIFSAFTFAYAIFEIPSGWLSDRFGPRATLTRIVVWWSIMTAVTGLATGFISLFIIRLLLGVGEAGSFPGIARVFSRWLPANDRGKGFGLAVMAAALGGALTQPLVAYLMDAIGWHTAFVVFGMVGIVWAGFWFWWFRNDPHHHQSVNEAELKIIGVDPPEVHPPVPWRAVLTSRNLWAVCAMYGGTIYGWYFYLTWLPSYLQRARGFDLKQASWLASLPYLGIATGVFLGGWISDHLCRRYGLKWGRKIPGLFGLPAAAVCILGAIYTTSPLHSAFFFAGAAGLAALGVAPGWAVCLEIGGKHAGVVSGAMNTFGNLGGALSPYITGEILQRSKSWEASLLSMAVFYGIAAVSWLFIDATRKIETDG